MVQMLMLRVHCVELAKQDTGYLFTLGIIKLALIIRAVAAIFKHFKNRTSGMVGDFSSTRNLFLLFTNQFLLLHLFSSKSLILH